MLKNEYYESIRFNHGRSFKVSRQMDITFNDKLHWHPFVEILVSLADGNEITINFTRYSMDKNDIVILYPGDLHSILQQEDSSILIIQFSNELLSIMGELSSNMALFGRCPVLKYDPFRAADDRRLLILKELVELYFTEKPFREVEMYALLLNFFTQVGEYCMAQAPEKAPEVVKTSSDMTKKMAEACLFIAQNCTQPLTLEDVADFMGISKSHFAHLFKQYTNTTFVDFLTEERIKRAQTLFHDPNKHIIDIAFDSGFSSISSFNRSFKKITGLSPSQFRETMIEILE